MRHRHWRQGSASGFHDGLFSECREFVSSRGMPAASISYGAGSQGWGAEGALVANDHYYCAECGQPNRASAAFCRHCGSPVGGEPPATSQHSDEPTSDIPAHTPLPEPGQTSQTDDSWNEARRNARRAGMGSGAPPPWAAALLIAILVLGGVAVAGWQTGWPRAIFGVQKTALVSPAGSAGASAGTPDQVSPASPASPTAPNSDSPATGTGPAAVIQAYFSAINARDYQAAWQLGGKKPARLTRNLCRASATPQTTR